MAKIWFGYEGDKALRGGPIAVRPLRWCVEELGLSKQDWKCILSVPSAPPTDNLDLQEPCEPIAVIIEVDAFDLVGFKGWQTGYYIPPLPPEGAKKRLYR